MDPNLQQFKDTDRYSFPIRFFVGFAALCLTCWGLSAIVKPNPIDDALMVTILEFLAQIFAGLSIATLLWDAFGDPKNWWLNVPARVLAGERLEGFFVIRGMILCPAQSGVYDLKSMKGLIYLFDKMEIHLSFTDGKELVKRDISFRVHFKDGVRFANSESFYRWYQGLHHLMQSDLAEVTAHLAKASNTNVMGFCIDDPLNPTIPRID